LNEQQHDWLRQAAAESSAFQREAWAQGVREALQVMQDEGVTVHEADPVLFMQATEAVRAKYAEGDIKLFVDRIQAVSE
jgi:TRAP-type C4-dicarboxylate transport system substrate-binding protein